MTSVPRGRMTGHERVRRAFEGREQDRVPRHDTFWPETVARWESEGLVGGTEGAYRKLGSDMQNILWYWPRPFPGRREIVSQDAETETVRDEGGALLRFWKGKSGTPEHLGWECESPEIWREKFLPALESQLVQLDLDTIKARFAKGRNEQLWTFLSGVEPFECLRAMLGDEISLMALIEEPEWIEEISRVTTDNTLRCFQTVLNAGIQPDGVWIYGDMAYNHSTHCSPRVYKELVWPQHKRLAEWAHQNAMKFIYHTDGDVNAVIELYIEAGFDCLQPLECKAHMNIRELCPRYGDRLAFFGNIDIMTMITNNVELIESEIAVKFAAGKATRRYIYHSDHSIPPQVSWKTYQQIIRFIERWGQYP